MRWLARLKPLAAVATVLIVATAGVVVQGRQQPEREQANTAPRTPADGPEAAANRALARKQLDLVDQALRIMHELGRNGRMSLSDASFSVWGRRRLDALHRAEAGKAEIVAALEKEVETLKQDEVLAKLQKDAARGTEISVLDVRFRRMEAEIWLNEEKAR